MLGIKDAFKKIYSGENTLLKHIVIFALTGITAMLSKPINEMSTYSNLAPLTIVLISLSLLFITVASVYLLGYLYGFMHNSFDSDKKDILPEFDKSWFEVFFKSLPILLSWLGYIILIVSLSILSHYIIGQATTLTILTILSTLMIIMIPLVFAAFSKNYERKGLSEFLLPFKYMKSTFKDVLWLMIKAMPLLLLVGIANGFLDKGGNVFAYVGIAIGAYVNTILNFAINFCYVQIYKEKLMPKDEA